MNTIKKSLCFMLLAMLSVLAFADNAPILGMRGTSTEKQGIGRLAVIRPNLPKSMTEEDVSSLWSTLEGLAAQQKTFKVIKRNDQELSAIIKEIGFQGTNLVDADGKKILPNKIKAVDTLLCCTILNFGNAWSLQMTIVNAQTAAIRTEYYSLDTFNSMEDIICSLEAQVKVLFNRMEIKDAMLVEPTCADGIKINANGLLNALEKKVFDKVSISGMHNLNALFEEMKKNGRDSMLARDWPRFRRIAAVRYLVEPKITKWKLIDDVREDSYNHEKTKICRLEAECQIQLVDTRDGALKAVIPLVESAINTEFEMTVNDFKENCSEKVFEDWAREASGKLASTIAELNALEEK